jgi:hypothetical protein
VVSGRGDLPSSDIPGATHVTIYMEPLHDPEWTDRLVAGRTNELDNLARPTASADS